VYSAIWQDNTGLAPETNPMERREAPFQAGRNARYLKPKGNDVSFQPGSIPFKIKTRDYRARLTKSYVAS
jgi:hypothetical protein